MQGKLKMIMKIRTQMELLAVVLLMGVSTLPGQAQAPAAEPKPQWQSSVAAGLTLTRGNSDTLLGSVSALTGKKWDGNELTLGADGTYGETKQQGVTRENAESLHGFIQYNRLFNERLFGYGRVEGLHDGVADIKYRVLIGPGVGYYFIKNKTTDLCGELGGSYVVQRLGAKDKSFAALRVGEKFHHTLNGRARIWQMAECQPQVDDFNNFIINAEIGIEADLTADKKFTLRSSLQDCYNNVPAAGRQKNDVKLITGIAYKF
jgi:putative salt-induced outer membrane protein YdiY